MPIPSPVQSDETIPDRTDVVIIGAGIAGIATALELAERRISVVVFEKGIVAGEQSSRNWGFCRQMGRDPAELPLIQVSMGLWRKMRQRTGEEVGYRENGLAILCEDEKQLAKRQEWFDNNVDQYGLATRMMSAKQAQVMTPDSANKWTGGIHTPDDGRAEPTLAVPAMARTAQKAGVKIFQNCAVRGLERRAGKISGVITEKGAIECSSVVLAGGTWSRRFCHNMGIVFPQLSVINSVMRTERIDAGFEHGLAGAHFAVRKRLDGGYTVANLVYSMADIMPDSFRLLPDFFPLLKDEWRDFRFRVGTRFVSEARMKRRWAMDEKSPFEDVRVLDPKPINRIQNQALQSLCDSLPIFKNAGIAEEWAGVIDVTPDAVPVISAVDHEPGFFMATGFSGHGFGLGPGAGKLMAEIVTGETPCVDPAPFRYSRYRSTASGMPKKT